MIQEARIRLRFLINSLHDPGNAEANFCIDPAIRRLISALTMRYTDGVYDTRSLCRHDFVH